jgi:hypothetical protein
MGYGTNRYQQKKLCVTPWCTFPCSLCGLSARPTPVHRTSPSFQTHLFFHDWPMARAPAGSSSRSQPSFSPQNRTPPATLQVLAVFVVAAKARAAPSSGPSIIVHDSRRSRLAILLWVGRRETELRRSPLYNSCPPLLPCQRLSGTPALMPVSVTNAAVNGLGASREDDWHSELYRGWRHGRVSELLHVCRLLFH